MSNEIPDKNIFMMCQKLNKNAISQLTLEFHIRNCRKDELDIWKAMPFDDTETADKYLDFMTEYFNNTYLTKGDLFYNKCLFVCDENDKPIATCFVWKAYDKINTIHWFKVLKQYEGRGIGRALLSIVMNDLKDNDYPVYLHTQPSSYRAIKLYSDFGFQLLSDEVIGKRHNDLKECLPILEKYMPDKDFNNLQTTKVPKQFIDVLESEDTNQF